MVSSFFQLQKTHPFSAVFAGGILRQRPGGKGTNGLRQQFQLMRGYPSEFRLLLRILDSEVPAQEGFAVRFFSDCGFLAAEVKLN
ncbi:MAG: hypothetical protein IJU00_01565 [Selenomonas sp.]|nr:hypothetical protein [Selenomonas sp.]